MLQTSHKRSGIHHRVSRREIIAKGYGGVKGIPVRSGAPFRIEIADRMGYKWRRNSYYARCQKTAILAKVDSIVFKVLITEKCAMGNCAVGYSVLLLLSLVVGCSDDIDPNTEAARQQQTNGWVAYDQKDISAALLSFERAVNLNPNLADAHNGLGWSRLGMSQVSLVNPQIVGKAKESFEDAIRIDPSNADAWVGLANTLFLRRGGDSDFQAALLALENAFDANHRFLFRHDYRSASDLHALKAACYFYLGKNDLAKASVQTAINLESQNPSALSLTRLLE